jgi:hypothetical protein
VAGRLVVENLAEVAAVDSLPARGAADEVFGLVSRLRTDDGPGDA